MSYRGLAFISEEGCFMSLKHDMLLRHTTIGQKTVGDATVVAGRVWAVRLQVGSKLPDSSTLSSPGPSDLAT